VGKVVLNQLQLNETADDSWSPGGLSNRHRLWFYGPKRVAHRLVAGFRGRARSGNSDAVVGTSLDPGPA